MSRGLWPLATRDAIVSRDLHTHQHIPPSISLISKWKRQGYEKLCCVRCIQSRDMNNTGSTCICRVPKSTLKLGTVVECVHCGEYYELRSGRCHLELCTDSVKICSIPCHTLRRLQRMCVERLRSVRLLHHSQLSRSWQPGVAAFTHQCTAVNDPSLSVLSSSNGAPLTFAANMDEPDSNLGDY